jgi:hypothetical protein
MIPRSGKLAALAFHLTKKVNKAEGLTYISTNIASKLECFSLALEKNQVKTER